MNLTFGIITNSQRSVNDFLPQVVQSIRNLNIPEYEIMIVGTAATLNQHSGISGADVSVIDFDEGQREGWITKKKNLITDKARFENIVYQHDYIIYEVGWYEAWRDFGEYHIGMNQILNGDGTRYRDWTIFPHGGLVEQAKKVSGFQGHECLLPYEEVGFSKLQYLSGAWWIAKREVMQRFRLNEGLVWGRGEDVEWSYKVREKHRFSINKEAKVKLLKQHNVAFTLMRPEVLEKMRNFLKSKNLYG